MARLRVNVWPIFNINEQTVLVQSVHVKWRNSLVTLSTLYRDVSTGATGATAVAPKFSDTLTLFQPWGADSAHHWRSRT